MKFTPTPSSINNIDMKNISKIKSFIMVLIAATIFTIGCNKENQEGPTEHEDGDCWIRDGALTDEVLAYDSMILFLAGTTSIGNGSN